MWKIGNVDQALVYFEMPENSSINTDQNKTVHICTYNYETAMFSHIDSACT